MSEKILSSETAYTHTHIYITLFFLWTLLQMPTSLRPPAPLPLAIPTLACVPGLCMDVLGLIPSPPVIQAPRLPSDSCRSVLCVYEPGSILLVYFVREIPRVSAILRCVSFFDRLLRSARQSPRFPSACGRLAFHRRRGDTRGLLLPFQP